jgi:hypothetical protein
MPRNRYDAAAGVCRIRWQQGAPSPHASPVLVEVWRPRLSFGTHPRLVIAARIELRVWQSDGWRVVTSRGSLDIPDAGEPRRWARLPYRWWRGTATIDGWDDDSGE